MELVFKVSEQEGSEKVYINEDVFYAIFDDGTTLHIETDYPGETILIKKDDILSITRADGSDLHDPGDSFVKIEHKDREVLTFKFVNSDELERDELALALLRMHVNHVFK